MSGVQWDRLTAAQRRALAARDTVVRLPIGAAEQNSPHLTTGVDDFLAAEVFPRAAVPASERTPVVTPSVPTWLSEHHMASAAP